MITRLIVIVSWLIAAGLFIPFGLVTFGIGGETLLQAGWIIPMITLYIGIPTLIFLLITALIGKICNKSRKAPDLG